LQKKNKEKAGALAPAFFFSSIASPPEKRQKAEQSKQHYT